MTALQSQTRGEAPNIGATITSPLIAAAEHRLPANINAAVVLADGRHVAFALGDGSVRLLALDDMAEPTTLTRHRGAVTYLARTGEALVSAGQDGAVLQSAPGNSTRPLIDFDGRWVDALAVHQASGRVAAASAKLLATAGDDGVTVLGVEDLPSSVAGLAFAPDGKRIAIAHLDGVTVVQADDGKTDLKLAWKGSHIGVTWSPDGRFIVSATQERELHVWDLVTMQDFRMGGYRNKVHGLAWSQAGDVLFCTGADVVTGWSFAQGGPAGKPPVEIGYVYNGLVTAVAAHPSSRMVAGGYSTGAVLIGGVIKGEALIARASAVAPVTALAWTPDGRKLVAGTQAGEAILMTLTSELEM